MPCRDDGYDDTKIAAERADLYVRCFCDAMTLLEKIASESEIETLRDETLGTWVSHKEYDRQREKREARDASKEELRKSGLSKLTALEAAALGIYP